MNLSYWAYHFSSQGENMSDSSNQLMPLSLSAPGVNLGAYISTVNPDSNFIAETEKSWRALLLRPRFRRS